MLNIRFEITFGLPAVLKFCVIIINLSCDMRKLDFGVSDQV